MGCGASQPSGPSFEPGRRGSVITASRLKDLQRGGHKRGGQSIARTAAPALPPSQPGRTSAVFYTFGEPSQGKATGYRRGSLTSVANGIFHLAFSHTPGALPALTDFPAALADGHGLTSPRSRASATEPKMTPSRASMRASVASVGQHATNARQSYVSRLGKDDLDDLWETESHADDEGSFKPAKKGTDASPREHTSSTTSTVTSQESAPATPRNHSKPLRVQRSAEMGADPAAMNGDGLPFAEDICGTYSCHGLDEGVDKANQDAACVAHPLQDDPEAALFVVLDGHGDAGSAVSEELLNQLYQHINAHSWGGADSTVDATLNIQKADATLAHQMALAFKRSHDALATFQLDPKTKQPAARESGAAAVVVILRRSRLIVAHVGDCRAVLGRLEPSSKHVAVGEAPGKVKFELTAVELTHDHKLETPEEAARIRSCGGFIRPAMEEPYYAPARVFKDLNKPSKGPGLTMSRSLGDMDADEVGVIPTPEVAFRSIHTEFDQFIVLASDGLWEFLTSEEVVEVVGGFLARGEPAINAARFLIVRAAQQWHREEEGVYRDDITCTVFYLKDLPAGLL